jgi:hypothetical protein
MIANIPVPQPDQTIESLAALVWMRNGWPSWQRATKAIFNRPTLDLAAWRHAGISSLFRHTIGTEPAAAVDDHSYLPIFRPFIPESVYGSMAADLAESRFFGGRGGSSYPQVIHQQAHYCTACMRQELAALGFAYMHRLHQINGVTVCLEHGEPLQYVIAPKDSIAAHGILCSGIDNQSLWQLTGSDSAAGISKGMRRFAQFVAAAIRGDIAYTSVQVRMSVIAHRLNMPDNSYFPGYSALAKLDRILKEEFGASFLERAGVAYLASLKEHLPDILLAKRIYTDNPIANLLVSAALFSSPAEYVAAVNDQCWRTARSRIKLPIGLVKDLIGGAGMYEMTLKYRVQQSQIGMYLSLFPEIAARRREAQERAEVARLSAKKAARKASSCPPQYCSEDQLAFLSRA